VDLIAGGFDAAIGGGFDLPPGMVARELGRIHLVAVASAAFLRGKRRPKDPAGLTELAGIARRSPNNSRVVTPIMRNSAGAEMAAVQKTVMMVDDPDALCRATLLGLGVGLVAVPHAAPHLESGALERLLPDWHCEVGPIMLYFASQKLLPAKTRAFVDFVTAEFRTQKLAQLFSASL
jgi:DNA-binding transcriptional LysR family regulator